MTARPAPDGGTADWRIDLAVTGLGHGARRLLDPLTVGRSLGCRSPKPGRGCRRLLMSTQARCAFAQESAERRRSREVTACCAAMASGRSPPSASPGQPTRTLVYRTTATIRRCRARRQRDARFRGRHGPGHLPESLRRPRWRSRPAIEWCSTPTHHRTRNPGRRIREERLRRRQSRIERCRSRS